MARNLIRGRIIDKNIIYILCELCRTHKKTVKLFEYEIYTESGRYFNFQKNGFKCCKCGLTVDYAAIERKPNSKIWHINLYGNKDGKEMLFTKDHIFPKSLGGKDNVWNYQVMCEECNSKKSNKIPKNLKYIVENNLIDSKVVFNNIKIANKLAKEDNKYLDKFLEDNILSKLYK